MRSYRLAAKLRFGWWWEMEENERWWTTATRWDSNFGGPGFHLTTQKVVASFQIDLLNFNFHSFHSFSLYGLVHWQACLIRILCAKVTFFKLWLLLPKCVHALIICGACELNEGACMMTEMSIRIEAENLSQAINIIPGTGQGVM